MKRSLAAGLTSRTIWLIAKSSAARRPSASAKYASEGPTNAHVFTIPAIRNVAVGVMEYTTWLDEFSCVYRSAKRPGVPKSTRFR